MKSLNARIFCYWTVYCIVGCSLLPELVIGARYLPTRRSIPTQLERNERLRELFQHILESERDAHLTAANQFADQLKLIQKKSNDFGITPKQIKDYNDEAGDDYDEKFDRLQYDGRKSHFQQRQKQPWRFVLSNYGHNHRNHKSDPLNSNANADGMHSPSSIGSSADDLVSSRSQQQQLMQKLYRGKQQKSSASDTNADASESTNDLDWITTDYDALYDDVNEKRSSSSNLKFDRYRRNGGGRLAQQKEHLN